MLGCGVFDEAADLEVAFGPGEQELHGDGEGFVEEETGDVVCYAGADDGFSPRPDLPGRLDHAAAAHVPLAALGGGEAVDVDAQPGHERVASW